MTAKRLLVHEEARAKVLAGAARLADAVRVTLGPKSRAVLIERHWGEPLVCNDGVTIAKELELEDHEENLGVRMMRQAAVRTGDAVGDGTTTATLLAYAVFSEGIRNVVAGASAIDLKRGLDRGLQVAVQTIRSLSRPLTTRAEKVQIATVSGHNDPSIGEMVADAFDRVGVEGVVSIEEAKGTESVLEVVEGMQFDRGYLSPYFVTDAERMEAVLDDALILLLDQHLTSMEPLVPLLEHAVRTGKSMLVLAEEIQGEALATLVVNRLSGTLRCVAVKAPGFGERRRAILEDIAILTGGRVISEELGLKLERTSPDVLGRAKRVVATKESTTLIGGGGERAAIDARQAQLRKEIAASTSDYDKEKLQERLAKLSGGVALIKAGAPTEAEMKSRKEAFEDAINATRAALSEGIVPGAGSALLAAAAALEAELAATEGDEHTGLKLLRTALEAPTRQLAENSGFDPGVVVERMRGKDHQGFDAATGRFVDLLEAGIVDPAKVVRIALENAVSIASVLLLTEGTLTELPAKHAEGAEAGPA